MDLLWKVSSKAKEILTQKEESTETQDLAKAESSSFSAGLGNDKPASSLSLETQQGNSDREASSESENVDSEHSASSPMSKESDRTYQGAEESEPNSVKMGISAGDLKDVSHKAVESAKSFGSKYPKNSLDKSNIVVCQVNILLTSVFNINLFFCFTKRDLLKKFNFVLNL